ncbi:hypothetical protein C7N43_34385 [Sphingobacteriales bacterium UPWRP_1]|nr:hypothetical protein BVG80_15485 [Sphingobacteriales bacterium TSM_CSM]PSJ72401.1 hypothetical protein C7N43_34385 [Sphingobacteriales bacterium UPWRP_1]
MGFGGLTFVAGVKIRCLYGVNNKTGATFYKQASKFVFLQRLCRLYRVYCHEGGVRAVVCAKATGALCIREHTAAPDTKHPVLNITKTNNTLVLHAGCAIKNGGYGRSL